MKISYPLKNLSCPRGLATNKRFVRRLNEELNIKIDIEKDQAVIESNHYIKFDEVAKIIKAVACSL